MSQRHLEPVDDITTHQINIPARGVVDVGVALVAGTPSNEQVRSAAVTSTGFCTHKGKEGKD